MTHFDLDKEISELESKLPDSDSAIEPNKDADSSVVRYSRIQEDRVATFYEFKGITRIIEAVRAKGYLVSLEDEKRIFDYVLGNPIREGMIPDIYFEDLISALNLKITPITTSKLFQESNLTVNSSSRVMDIFYCFCVSKNLSLTEIANNISKVSQTYSKIYKETEKLELVFREIETTLIKDFGIETYKIFSLLVCYQYENEDKIINGKLTVSGKELLSYAKRKNNLYRDKNIVKRTKLEDNFNWLANQLDLLTIPRLICPKIVPSGKNKQDIVLNNTALIEIGVGYKPTKEGIFDLSNIPDMIITYSIPWFDYFNSKKYLIEYGYTHKEAFNTSGLISALLHWLSFKLEQNQDGDFKIKTIIEQVGLKAKLDAIHSETDSKKLRDFKKDLYRVVMSALIEIKKIDDPYQWEFKNAPQWLLDETLKKPRGWFYSWLDVVIVFKHPQVLIDVGKEYRREKKNEVTPEAKPIKLTVNDLKSALAQYSDNKNVSLRKLAEAYGTSQPTLSRKLKSGKFTQFELRDLMKWVHILGKKKS
ncbi:helix-turn-helix domain-containing protein [Cyanobacterium aponinum]|uniref:helix-turn-helix domain-containing protein n=1 Tax=Cyanobacterium aponinum TaxID=379064 RepID=UPI000C12D45A|nr:helix-turn-helix domain-containing protein [Cyanobacterium aponinum]PHV61005.1 hypothetical protein CSQ80_17920 [Cyanobacterium aponinum IPPAS B-1201]